MACAAARGEQQTLSLGIHSQLSTLDARSSDSRVWRCEELLSFQCFANSRLNVSEVVVLAPASSPANANFTATTNLMQFL